MKQKGLYIEDKIRKEHELKVKKYIENKLRDIERDIGISIDGINTVGYTASDTNNADCIICYTTIEVKLMKKYHCKKDNNGDGECLGIYTGHLWKYDKSGDRTCIRCKKYEHCPDYYGGKYNPKSSMY